jgi:hypothetical protein
LKNGIFVSQGKYIKDLLKKFSMSDSKSISTPMGTNGNLDSDATGNMMDQKLYRSMIGSLLFVTASRSDVMFSVCMCVGFQALPRESHLKATKRILRYLKHTQNVSLCYPKRAKFELVGYWTPTMRDASLKGRAPLTHVNCWEDHLFHGHQRSNNVALSTTKAKYIFVSSCCAQILWMKATLSDFGIKFKKVSLLYDNESAIKLTNNPVQHARTKHIDVHHHFIRDH